MRNAVPIVLLVLAAAVGVWLLTGADEELVDPDYEVSDPGAADPTGAMSAEGIEAGGMRVKGQVPSKHRAPVPIVDPRKLPKGVLLITMLGPDLKPLDAGALRVYVEPLAGSAWRTKLGVYDKDTQAWRFERIVAGPVSVRIQGDHIVARTVQTVVKQGRDNDFSVTLDLAGAVQYDVMAYDKTRPDKVKLTLYDYRDQPVTAWYQERALTRMTTPKTYETAEIGPEGVVFGILPGRYRLKVVSPNDEWDEAEVEIVAGKTARVSLEVRR